MKPEGAYPGGQCEFITQVCQQKTQSIFKFLTMYYCGFQSAFGDAGKVIFFFPVGAFVLFVAMFTL